MQEEDPGYTRQIKAELQRLLAINPNCVPVYLIINSNDQSELPNIPILLYKQQLTIEHMTLKLKKKYEKYKQVYLFGKDHSNELQGDLSLRDKRKMKRVVVDYEGQKVIQIDKEMMQVTVGDAFKRFKSDDGMLVVVLSQKVLIKPEAKAPASQWKQTLLLVLVFIAGAIYLILYFSNPSQSPVEPVDSL